MTNEQLAAQAQLAADILRTGHPWEWHSKASCAGSPWLKNGNLCPIKAIGQDYEIRLALATPGDNRPLHNPDNLTAEQVGAGWRLCLATEEANTNADLQEYWIEDEAAWSKSGKCTRGNFGSFHYTYRLPLSTPWPEAKVEPRIVPLVAFDVPPGSVFRFKAKADWVTPLCVGDGAVGFPDPNDGRVLKMSFSDLMETAEINKSIPITGKWDADAWEKCEKEAVWITEKLNVSNVVPYFQKILRFKFTALLIALAMPSMIVTGQN